MLLPLSTYFIFRVNDTLSKYTYGICNDICSCIYQEWKLSDSIKFPIAFYRIFKFINLIDITYYCLERKFHSVP